jgi:cell division protein FtsI (penicillin-binding protein 3)
MTAAQMRKMMEGVVLYGTGKQAQLNGYSSGGKTGTAQKIDPLTRTYSKTMHIASFAGIAPVNNPVIAVAVVLDNPKGALYYGATVSAPIFQEVAQQILEYLGVPHDIDLRVLATKKTAETDIAEDDSSDNGVDVNSLYAAINDLPTDDPLREVPAQPSSATEASSNPSTKAAILPAGLVARAKIERPSAHADAEQAAEPPSKVNASLNRSITVNDGRRLKVPSLVGLPVREVIEQASAAGLVVQISGNGTVREQAPAPGTLVANGTQVVVRCTQ